MASIYSFRSGRSLRGVDPQATGLELERIRAENDGSLNAELVLAAAKEEASPLHQAFTWDDEQAAHKHRLNEARRLITSIKVFSPSVAKPVTAFVSVRTPDKGRNYVPVIEAMSDEEMATRVMMEIQQALESIERRYAHFAGIKEILGRVKQAAG